MSDRQLNQYDYHRLRVDIDRLLSQGLLWDYTFVERLDVGESGIISLTTGASPVLVAQFQASFVGNSQLDIRIYSGGSISGEVPVTGTPANDDQFSPSPLSAIGIGGDVFVPGEPIGGAIVSAGSGVSARERIFARNSNYYFEYHNVVPSDQQLSGTWDYRYGNATPLDGEITHESNGRTMRIAYIDADSGDRTAELQALPLGSFIDHQDVTWHVTEVNSDVTSLRVTVEPSVRAPLQGAGLFVFLFGTPSAITVDTSFSVAALPPADLM